MLTHDAETMAHSAYARVQSGLPMPGVFEVGRRQPIGAIIEDLLLLAGYSEDGEWEGQVRYLPLA